MKFRTALICSAVAIAAGFGLKAFVFAEAPKWVAQSIELSAFHRYLIGAAVFWAVFWWVAALLIVGFFMAIAVVTSIVRYFRNKNKAAANVAIAGQ